MILQQPSAVAKKVPQIRVCRLSYAVIDAVGQRHPGPNSVSVETKSLNGNLADYPFHLSVVCTSSFAVVNGSSIVRGDAQTVTRLGQGRYEVTFPVPLVMCSYTASIGNPDSSTFANAGMIFTAGGHISQNGVYVETKNMGGGLSDFPFHLRSTCPSVWGFADLHTHPATHLGFGADHNGNNGLIWGKPAHDGALDDLTSLLDQNLSADLAACPQGSFGPINLGFTHNASAGLDFVTTMTDALVVSDLDATSPGYTHQSQGWPGFGTPQSGWPAALTVDHQVMHIDHIKRAFQGGLRLLFAAAADDELISDVWNQGFNLFGNPAPVHDATFDFNSAVRQLTYITDLVNSNSDFMQIVTTPSQARAVITGNPPKLAVVLSLEMDSLSLTQIQQLVQQFGVAHVIPVHLADNHSFGGTAIYSDLFNGLSNFINGSPENSSLDSNVNYHLGTPPAHIEPVTLNTVLPLSTGQLNVVDIALAGAVLLGPIPASTISLWALTLQFGIDLMPTGAMGYQPVIPSVQNPSTPGEVNTMETKSNSPLLWVWDYFSMWRTWARKQPLPRLRWLRNLTIH